MLPIPELKNKNEDIIFKMRFNITQHKKIQMYNYVWLSTRALQLDGCDIKSQTAVEAWLNDNLYRAYAKIRTIATSEDVEVVPATLKSVMEQYCSFLKTTTPVADYWVTIIGEKTRLDSRQMGL